MWPIRPSQYVGREPELAVLHAAVEALARGEGSVAWVEGEPGIGKSSLVAEAIAAASQPGWEVGWASADQITARLPLRVMQECLQVRASSPDPRRAHAADLLRSRLLDPDSDGDMSVGIEVLLTLVDELCAAAPTVLVIDDLQWADDSSLAVWHQLAASISQLRLLLIATCRPTPRGPEVQQARTAVARRGGQLIDLGPLADREVAALVTALVGAPPGDGLRRLTAQAAGNPLYVRELVDALLRDQAVQIRPVADIAPAEDRLPASLATVLDDRLSSVSAETAQLLRTAALLGGRFAVTDLAVILHQSALALAVNVQEAVTAGIVEGAGAELAFRHPLIQQVLYESMPEALRTALHAEVARELATAGADALRVAQQLSAAGSSGDGWARAWLIESAPTLTIRAPLLAAELLRWAVGETPAGGAGWDVLIVGLVRALLAVGAYQEAVARASGALTGLTDPALRGEASWLLAHATVAVEPAPEAAIAVLRQALAEASPPPVWEARLLALLAMLERGVGGIGVTDTLADQALAAAERTGDPFTLAHALAARWLASSVLRDHVTALACVDRALNVMGDDPRHDVLRSNFLDNRIFVLQNLGDWTSAQLALRQARESALRTGRPDRATWATAAVLQYWLGRWDDALAELGADATDTVGLAFAAWRERWAAPLVHGVAALIAGRREERTTADEHLKEGLALPVEDLTHRENRDFLIAAHALSLEQRGETRQAMLRLAELLPRRANETTLIYQWLPDLVRLAKAAGDSQLAQAAAQACQAEAAAETQPARPAAASLRCQGLLESDPDPLLEAVAHYRSAGPALDLAAALEDLAVVLAEHGSETDARAAMNEAIGLYEGMQARWDVRRAEGRLRPHGIKRGVRGRRPPRPTTGWAALTPTEVNIAALVARGDSTSDIARSMFLSRRTVQTYISHILTKLEAKSRVDIATEALRQGVTP